MKNLITYLKALWSWGLDSQSTDVSLDCRLTVGSPSAHRRHWTLKLMSVLVLLLTIGSGNAWGTTLGTKTVSTTAATTLADGDIVIMSDGTNYFSGTMTAVSKSKNWVQTTTTKTDAFLLKVVGEYNNTTKSYKLQDYDGTKGYFKSTSASQTVWDTQSSNATSFTSLVGVGDYIYKYNSSGYRRYNNTSSGTVSLYKVSIATGPTITTSVSSLTEVGYSTANFSQQVKSFTVSGSSLTANVTVTAPTNYEVCKTSGGTYTSSVSFDKGSGTLAASIVYVRLQSGKTAGNYSGNVACSSSGATIKNVAVSGSVPFTVTWKANGTTHATTYVTYATGTGTALGSLPDDPDPSDYTCTPKAFYGWYEGDYSHASTAPTCVTTATKITSNKTYNAVFATSSGGGAATWTETAIGDLTGSDIFVIVGNNGSTYAMTNNNGTSSAPSASSVTISAGKITSSVSDNIKWNISGNSTDGYVFYPNGSTTTWLYCTNANNGLRVGTGENKTFSITSDYLYNEGQSRYVGIYNSSDWRSYTSINDNIKDQTFAFYKYGAGTTYSAYSTSCSSTAKTITIVPVAGGTVTTSPSGSAEAGNTVTITLTPDAHYTVGGAPTVVDANSQSVAVSGSGTSYTFTMPNANVTITPATWNPINVTIYWHRKTGTTPEAVLEGTTGKTFPNTTDVDAECAPFLGWITGTTWEDSFDEPATYYASGAAMPDPINADVHYTAIYREKVTTIAPAYTKVTAAPSAPNTWAADDGLAVGEYNHYLIVYEDADNSYAGAVAFDGKRDDGDNGNIDAASNTVAVTISDNTIAKTARLAAAEWKIEANSTYWAIKSASGKYIGHAADANALTTSTTALNNTLSMSSGDFGVVCAGGAYLRYNPSSGQERFRYYKSSTYSGQKAIQLYKLGEAEVNTYTYTKNPACTPRYRVTVNSATGGSPSSDKLMEPEGETITLTANPAAGYSFTEWAMENSSTHADASTLLSSTTAETATFTLPAYDVTVTAAYSKKAVTELKVMDGSTVVANTTGSVSGTLNVSTGANKTLDVVITPADAFDHSWTASVTAGGTYASISNVTDDGFRVNGLSQGDATVTVTAPNDGNAKVVTFTVHVTDVLPEEIILKRDGSVAEIETLTMYYDAANSRGQYVKVNVSYSPTPTNKNFTFTSAATGKVGSHSHSNVNLYEVLVANGVTSSPVNCTFTSEADGSVTKVLAVTVLPLLTDRFVDYIQGNATQTVSARLSADRYDIITDINTPSISDASDANPTSEDCKTAHYHMIGWLPQATAEALWAAGTAITEDTEGLVSAGATVEATGQTWYAIWAKEE